MRAREAAKLHKGDRIVLKHTGEEVIVDFVDDTCEWGVWVKTEEGHDAHHKEIKCRATKEKKVVLTCTIDGEDRRTVAETLALLAIEIARGFEFNGAGHFGREGNYDFDLITKEE